MTARPLQPQQRKALRSLFSKQPSVEQLQSLNRFLNVYFQLESVLRKLCHYHREGLSKPRITKEFQSLNIQYVRSAAKSFGIRLPEDSLTEVLDSSKTKRNEKSARELRNAIVHQWSIPDIIEIAEREKILSSCMSAVLSAIEENTNRHS